MPSISRQCKDEAPGTLESDAISSPYRTAVERCAAAGRPRGLPSLTGLYPTASSAESGDATRRVERNALVGVHFVGQQSDAERCLQAVQGVTDEAQPSRISGGRRTGCLAPAQFWVPSSTPPSLQARPPGYFCCKPLGWQS